MDSAMHWGYPIEENEVDKVLRKKKMTIADIPDLKKSYISFHYSGQPVSNLSSRKEQYVSLLMTLDDETCTRLLNDAVKENEDLAKYKSKMESASRRVNSFAARESAFAVLQEKKNVLRLWKDKYYRKLSQTEFEFSILNECLKDKYESYDQQINSLKNQIVTLKEEQKQKMDLKEQKMRLMHDDE